MKKTPPPKTLEDLRPPHRNYHYFQDWQANSFRHDAKSFELVNAWWLADAALLAYGDGVLVFEQFATSGLLEAGFTVESFSEKNVQCFVAHNDNFIFAAFRGTEIDNFWGSVKDIATDSKFVTVPDGAGGLVHHGFNDALELIWEPLKTHLSAITSDGKARTLWLAGHSLGAALATLAADRIIRLMTLEVSGLYTYGSPRVGNGDFKDRLTAEGLAARTYRIVNNTDVIAKVPPKVVYRHVGALKLIDAKGHLTNVDDESQIADDAAEFDFKESAFETIHSIFSPGGITKNAPDYLADHAPIYYAIHIWNHYETQST